MKHYSTAKEILEESIKDIAAGFWCGGKLAAYGATEDNAFEFTNSYVGLETSTAMWPSFVAYEKPQGCAVGLLAMYGGLGYPFKQKVDGVEYEGFCPTYIAESYTEGDKGRPVVDALIALYDALPEEKREVEEYPELHKIEACVIDYNDEGISREVAEAWFRRALALVESKVTV